MIDQNQKKSLFALFSLLGISLLSACGSSQTETVRVNFLSNSNWSQSNNLMQAITSLPPPVQRVAADGTCMQKNLFVGLQTGGPNAQVFEVHPTGLRTPYNIESVIGSDDISKWLNDNASGPSIDLKVPHGATVDIGIIGNVISSPITPAGDDCEDLVSASPFVNTTYTLVGHRDQITVNNSMPVTLPIWALKSNSSTAPSTNAKGDFIQVTCNACNSSPLLVTLNQLYLKFEYFYDANPKQTAHPSQIFKLGTGTVLTSGATIYLPSLKYVTASIIKSAGGALLTVPPVPLNMSKTGDQTLLTFPFSGASVTLTLTATSP